MHATGESGTDGVVSFVETVVDGIGERNVSFMAGSIAYQAFVSLIPLLVLVFFLVSAIGDEALAERAAAATEGSLPESGQELLADAIAGSVATAGASIIGLVTLLWGTLKIFRGLDTAFSEIYGSTGETSLVGQLRDALIVFAALVTALAAAAVASTVFALVPDSPLIGVLNPVVLVVALTAAFYPMYYYFPDVDVTWREVLPGVVVAAVGWAALQGLFQVYVAYASGGGAGDALGAILLLLTWLYFGGFVLLVGAVVNAARADRLVAAEPADDTEDDDRTVDRGIDRLERRLRELDRERDRLYNDLAAQRSRRYELEDETTALARRVDGLERENARLRRRLVRRRGPLWQRVARRLVDGFDRVSVGTVRRSRR